MGVERGGGGVRRGKRSEARAPMGPVIKYQYILTMQKSNYFSYLYGINACKFIAEKTCPLFM